MKKAGLRFLILCLIVVSSSFAQIRDMVYISEQEKELFEYWAAHHSLKFDLIECMLIAEGRPDEISRKNKWLDTLEKQVADEIDSDSSPESKGEKLYEFLQKKALQKFSAKASAVSLIEKGEFNCVTSTALYSHFGTRLNIPMLYHTVPFHVCPVIEDEGKKIWVEVTSPKKGFDAHYNRSEIVQRMFDAKLVTADELKNRGVDSVFDDFIKGHYKKSPGSILAYHYYNCAVNHYGTGNKFDEIFWSQTKATVLDQDDEIIKGIYDATFFLLCAKNSFLSSQYRIAKSYFTLRGKDSVKVDLAVPGAMEVITALIREHGNFSLADSLITMIDSTIVHTPITDESLRDTKQYYSILYAYELSKRGQYGESFLLASKALAMDPKFTLSRDVYADVGIKYVDKSFRAGNDELAFAAIDSMRKALPDYESLNDEYVRVILNNTLNAGQYRNDPSKARRRLLLAHEIDSTEIYVIQGLVNVYHELAMADLRKNDWRSAREHINEGLRFDPDSEFLKSDLNLLHKAIPKSKK